MANATTTWQPPAATLDGVLRQIAERRNLPNLPSPSNGAPNGISTPTTRRPSMSSPDCPVCSGMGYFLPDLPAGELGYGKIRRCPRCDTGLAARSGLNEQELRIEAASIRGASPMTALLRWLVGDVLAAPAGWLTLWGAYGTAKTMAAQAIVAGCVRQAIPARFYHARKLEDGWFQDIHGDSANGQLYREIPVLCIDEIDKANLTNDWVRKGLQELLDTRYRSAIAGQTLTILICQVDPAGAMPGDIHSRMSDGRFYRQWTAPTPNRYTVERWGARYVPGIVHVEGPDQRPQIKPMRKVTA
jgi:hypothetical protein